LPKKGKKKPPRSSFPGASGEAAAAVKRVESHQSNKKGESFGRCLGVVIGFIFAESDPPNCEHRIREGLRMGGGGGWCGGWGGGGGGGGGGLKGGGGGCLGVGGVLVGPSGGSCSGMVQLQGKNSFGVYGNPIKSPPV